MENLTNEKKKFIFILIFRIISILIILFCLFLLYNWNLENNKNSEIADTLTTTSNEDYISIKTLTPNNVQDNKIKVSKTNFNDLLMKNQNTVAWIMINNTNINYPIVQYTDNDFYLKHNFNNETNSAGWIYADYRNKFDTLDKNTIIYGHNRRNGTMFSNLKSYLDYNWYSKEENKYFSFNTINGNYIAEIFSVYKINSKNFTLSNSFDTVNEFENELNSWKQKSIYDFKTEVDTSNKIITLCTCDNNTDFRIVIHAKLIILQ